MESHIINDSKMPDRTATASPRSPGPAAGRRRPVTAIAPAAGDALATRATRPPDVRVALDAFRRIVQALRVGGGGAGRAGLGSAQMFALQQIAEHPDASVNEIAALTCTHQSSVSVVIQRLVQQRLVARVASTQDRRRQRLAVTAKGRRVLGQAPVAVQEELIAAIASLPAAERRALAKSLSAVSRRVAPGGHPPMFFEDPVARRERPDRRRADERGGGRR
jgi:DNA-binding MarR family transcriptional regulator